MSLEAVVWGSCNQGSHPAQIKPALRLWGQQTAVTSGHHTRARRAVRGESAALGLGQPRGGGVATWQTFQQESGARRPVMARKEHVDLWEFRDSDAQGLALRALPTSRSDWTWNARAGRAGWATRFHENLCKLGLLGSHDVRELAVD